MIFVVGSHAIRHLIDREPTDIDLLGTAVTINQLLAKHEVRFSQPTKFGSAYILRGVGPVDTEVAVGSSSSSTMLLKYLNNLHSTDKIEQVFGDTAGQIVDPSVVLMMKHSHKYLKDSPHFLKTMRDIQALQNAGIQMPAFANIWLPIRERETYTYSHPKLNQKRDTFFADQFYVYDHDSLHEAVALYGKPAYLQIKNEGSTVLCDKTRFWALPADIQLATVWEEAAVLALERWMIPSEMKADPNKGFEIALMKVCTSIASGWWREFAWNNYDRVLDLQNRISDSYVDRFYRAKWNNKLVPWTKPESVNETA